MSKLQKLILYLEILQAIEKFRIALFRDKLALKLLNKSNMTATPR